MGIAERTVFTGRLAMDQVPAHHRMIDVFANLSRSESFGVSVIEASATAVPVVATCGWPSRSGERGCHRSARSSGRCGSNSSRLRSFGAGPGPSPGAG
ncbi:MAG: glycosyltransferase [Flavobacteriales bacterium]|nr:glycosyltransferase [Flavobacteriales bacterium]